MKLPRTGSRLLLLNLLVGLTGWQGETARAADPAADIISLTVAPSRVVLRSRRSAAQLVVSGHLANGRQIDLTRRADFQVTTAGRIRVTAGRVAALADGTTELIITAAGQTARVPVTVSGTDRDDPIRFRHETLAVITKQGCNAGSCHGSPDGKGGFSLSLFAFDPEIDKRALVRGGFNRRTNVYDPDQSLILKKPLLRIPHVGGKRLRTSDVAYRILHDWIHEGARDNAADLPECTGIEIRPGPARVLHDPHLQQQISVTAHFADGPARDVTRIATYDTSHKEVATVDAGRSGQRASARSLGDYRPLPGAPRIGLLYLLSAASRLPVAQQRGAGKLRRPARQRPAAAARLRSLAVVQRRCFHP